MSDSNKSILSYRRAGAGGITGAYPGVLAAALSSAVLTFAGNPANNDTVTINAKVYTFKTILTPAADEILIGGDADESLRNLIAAINADPAGAGFYYGTGTAAHTTVFAEKVEGSNAMTVYSKTHGVNAYAVSESSANLSWSAANMSGGAVAGATGARIPFVSHTFKHRKDTAVSEEIVQDRSRTEIAVLGSGDEGGFVAELRLGLNAHNDFFLYGLMGTLVTASDSHDVNVNPANQSALFANPAPTATLKGAKVIKFSGLPTAANNGLKRVIKWVGDTAYFVPGSFTVDDPNTVSVTAEVSYYRNGATAPEYFAIQDNAIDAGSYQIHQGMCVNELTLELAAKAKAMLTVGFLGYGSFERPDSVFTSIAEPATGNIVETTNHIGALYVDNRTPVAAIRNITWKLNNNLRERLTLQRGGTLQPGTGFADFTGTLEAYFSNAKAKRAFLNHSDKSIFFSVQSGSGSGQIHHFFLPKVKFTDMEAGNPGGNQDLMTVFEWQAIKDTTLGYQCQIDTQV